MVTQNYLQNCSIYCITECRWWDGVAGRLAPPAGQPDGTGPLVMLATSYRNLLDAAIMPG